MKTMEVQPKRKEVLDEYYERLRERCNECNVSYAYEGVEGTFKGELKE
ncbi:hypothetical protein ABEW34_31375 [Paenibacillus algorifonticola]